MSLFCPGGTPNMPASSAAFRQISSATVALQCPASASLDMRTASLCAAPSLPGRRGSASAFTASATQEIGIGSPPPKRIVYRTAISFLRVLPLRWTVVPAAAVSSMIVSSRFTRFMARSHFEINER